MGYTRLHNSISSMPIMASVEIPAIIPILVGFLLSYLALGAATNSAASGSVVVTGNVFCDACLEVRPSQNGYVISGASVALECSLNRKTMTISITAETDENGQFKLKLPSNIFHSADPLNKCWVKPLRSPYNFCRIPSNSEPSRLTLLSESNGVVTYNAGSFSYRHETVPASCYREAVLRMIKGRGVAENFDQSSKPSQQIPTIPLLPKLPLLSLPNHPPLTNSSIPPLHTISPLPEIPPLPRIPLPTIPPHPPLPTLPRLPKIPRLPPHTFPPSPKNTVPGLPPLAQIP